MKMTRHFIDLDQLTKKDIDYIVDLSISLKKQDKNSNKQLLGKNIAVIFEKSSTRTRVSFEVGINQLGGSSIIMNANDMQISKGEIISDTSQVLSRYVDAIVIRANSHQTILDLAKYAKVPVINALSNFSHPCQIIASIVTFKENFDNINDKKIVWFGEQNNVLNSYIHIAKFFEFELVICSHSDDDFCKDEIIKAQKSGAKINIIQDPKRAAKNADILITDTWFSMGDKSLDDENLKMQKINKMLPYQVNNEIMALAKKDAIFSHCLPAYRGFEVSAQVIDSKQSVIFDEAENRLHAQKAILLWLFKESC